MHLLSQSFHDRLYLQVSSMVWGPQASPEGAWVHDQAERALVHLWRALLLYPSWALDPANKNTLYMFRNHCLHMTYPLICITPQFSPVKGIFSCFWNIYNQIMCFYALMLIWSERKAYFIWEVLTIILLSPFDSSCLKQNNKFNFKHYFFLLKEPRTVGDNYKKCVGAFCFIRMSSKEK